MLRIGQRHFIMKKNEFMNFITDPKNRFRLFKKTEIDFKNGIYFWEPILTDLSSIETFNNGEFNPADVNWDFNFATTDKRSVYVGEINLIDYGNVTFDLIQVGEEFVEKEKAILSLEQEQGYKYLPCSVGKHFNEKLITEIDKYAINEISKINYVTKGSFFCLYVNDAIRVFV